MHRPPKTAVVHSHARVNVGSGVFQELHFYLVLV